MALSPPGAISKLPSGPPGSARTPSRDPPRRTGETYRAQAGAEAAPSCRRRGQPRSIRHPQWGDCWPGAPRARSASRSRSRAPATAPLHFPARLYLALHLPDPGPAPLPRRALSRRGLEDRGAPGASDQPAPAPRPASRPSRPRHLPPTRAGRLLRRCGPVRGGGRRASTGAKTFPARGRDVRGPLLPRRPGPGPAKSAEDFRRPAGPPAASRLPGLGRGPSGSRRSEGIPSPGTA